MRANKKISLAIALALILSFIATTKVVCAANGRSPFSDVPSEHWGIDGIIAAYDDGVMTGTYYNASTGERQFSPAASLTLAEWSVMLYRAFYADESFIVPKENWWNRECDLLSRHGIYKDWGALSNLQVNGPISRTGMAVTIANLIADKGITVDTNKVAAAKAQIADINDIFPMHQDAVATAFALGIIKGVGNNRFNGTGNTERAAAATVYLRVKNVLNGASTGDDKPPVPSTPPSASPVGTMSATKLNLGKNNITTHAPVVDYWSQQPMEIRNISDRDSFNAACQTIHDSKMVLTQGEINALGRNLYYNYSVVADKPVATQKNVVDAMGALCGYSGDYGAQGTGCLFFTIRPLRTATITAPRFASTIAQIKANPGMSDMEKARLCVKAVCDQIDYALNGGASWDNGKPTGDCESYARMLNQILSAAGIPNMNIAGTVAGGGHAWVHAKLDGQWYAMDGTITEGNPNATVFTFAEHEKAYGYTGINDRDAYKVAHALIDTAYPTDFAL